MDYKTQPILIGYPTNFDKIIKNAKAFIDAGGFAKWHMLVFEHNEQTQVEEARQMAQHPGFKTFTTKHTQDLKEIICK